MNKFKFLLGLIWSSPITLACFLFYVLPCWLFGWYSYKGFHDIAFVWTLNKNKSPNFLLNLWKKWAGHALGNLIVLSNEDDFLNTETFTHEIQHVHQCMRLGIFQPIIYFICLIAIKLGCKNSDPYYSNPFEIDARRGAGQIIDVEGYLKKSEMQHE
jgi:hypothetical protein